MMERIINDFVKNTGVSIILTKKIFRGVLDVFYYNWVGDNDEFYSLLVPCSKSMVYTKSSLSFENKVTLPQAINENLKIFGDKESWHQGMWTCQYAENFCDALQHEIKLRSKRNFAVGQYHSLRIDFHLQPCLGMTVWYSDGYERKPLTVWHGAITNVVERDLAFLEFVRLLGIGKCVNVVLQDGNRERLTGENV